MLHALDSKTVQGDDFRVVVPDVHTVVYSDSDRTARVELEGGRLDGVADWIVYSETISGWYRGDGREEMTVSDKDLVLCRISDSLKLLDMPHRVV
jgi:hypothetical protein